MIEQETPSAIVYRRDTKGFTREVYVGREAVIQFDQPKIELPLAEVYLGLQLVPEDDGE
jgi:hypothetical protein